MSVRLIIILCFSLYAFNVSAHKGKTREYTKENPLVYEGSQSLWPYSFLNDKGEPEGYNIDLLRLLMDKLDIPYVIRLKPHQEALHDLKAHQCDLTLGSTGEFSQATGLTGRALIIMFTQSVATPKGQAVKIKTFRDLGKNGQQVIVSDYSFCHQLMTDYGWKANAIVSNDMGEAIQQMSNKKEGQMVWNTLSLRWLINHHHLGNLAVTPVNMPHGECRYLANDRQLLDLLDKAYSELSADGEISNLESKWFYPDHDESESSVWEWCLAALSALLFAIVITYIVHASKQSRRMTETNNDLSSHLTEIAEAGKVRVWIYRVRENQFVWLDKKGAAVSTLASDEFAKRYNKKDFTRLKAALYRLANQHKDAKGHEEIEETLELKARDEEHGDGKLHDFVVVLSILSRDKHGRPTLILGTKRDVTREHSLRAINNSRSLSYWSVFYNDEAGIIICDKDGYIENVNPKACELFACDTDEIVSRHIHIKHFLRTQIDDLHKINGLQGTYTLGKTTVDYQLKTVYNDKQELINIFAFCL